MSGDTCGGRDWGASGIKRVGAGMLLKPLSAQDGTSVSSARGTDPELVCRPQDIRGPLRDTLSLRARGSQPTSSQAYRLVLLLEVAAAASRGAVHLTLSPQGCRSTFSAQN